MVSWAPRNPRFDDAVRDSFSRQRLMATLSARLIRVSPGEVDIAMPFAAGFTQQHGYLHAGVISALADSACGYAALTLMEPDADVVSVEFKVNFLAPAVADEVIARGRVKRAGRTITVCGADVVAIRDGQERLISLMQATMMAVYNREQQNP